jgi:hypothetical protein
MLISVHKTKVLYALSVCTKLQYAYQCAQNYSMFISVHIFIGSIGQQWLRYGVALDTVVPVHKELSTRRGSIFALEPQNSIFTQLICPFISSVSHTCQPE